MEIIMKCYDARTIESCCVFSYEVKLPERSDKKTEKRKRSSFTWKKILLHLLFILLYPFAFLIDSVVMGAQKIFRKCRTFLCRCDHGYIVVTCILSTFSATATVPLLMTLI